jgi:beta-glucanase (GH16 family)
MHVALHGTGYYGGDNIGSSYNLRNGERFADDFHLFAVEWEPSRIRWYVDNRLFFTATPAQVPAGSQWLFNGRPFFLILNVAVGGKWPGSPDATTLLPQQLKVDFVRVYRRVSAAPAMLRITTVPGGTEASWAATFPHARLQQATDPGAPWLDVPTDGVRVGNEFVAGVSPGFYRLVWTE